METFMKVYAEELRRAIEEKPSEYAYGIVELPVVLERMRMAVQRSSFNKDSYAFRWTCTRLGIKHTYKAIDHFIQNHE